MNQHLPETAPELSQAGRQAIHVALFVASFCIYSLFRAMWTTTVTADHSGRVDGSILGSLAVLFFLPALAFGTASWFQPRWTSRNAGTVASVVWLVVNLGYYLMAGCPRILLLVAIPFVPYCLGALVGHNIGRFHHPAHWDGYEMNLEE